MTAAFPQGRVVQRIGRRKHTARERPGKFIADAAPAGAFWRQRGEKEGI